MLMFYGGCRGTLNTGINGAQPRGRKPDQCHAQHRDLSPPGLFARSLASLWPLPAVLPPAQLAGWYQPGDVPSRLFGCSYCVLGELLRTRAVLHCPIAGSKSFLWSLVFIMYKRSEGLPPLRRYGWCPLPRCGLMLGAVAWAELGLRLLVGPMLARQSCSAPATSHSLRAGELQA